MTLDNPSRTEKIIAAYKGWPLAVRVVAPMLLLLVLIGAFLWFESAISNAWFRHTMNRANANVVKELDKLSNIQDQQAAKEKELQQLQIDEAAQKQKVIDAAKDAEAAAKAEAEANNTANQAAQNTAAVNAQDFTNTSLENAEAARCKAFPDSCK